MIELTERQRQCIEQGEPLRVSEGNLDLVLLRADVFENLQALLETTTSQTAPGLGPNDIAKRIAEFRLPVVALRQKAKTTPPPKAWFEESLDELF